MSHLALGGVISPAKDTYEPSGSKKFFKKNRVYMPKPKRDETKNEYIARCVKEVRKEGKNIDQALAQCYGMWKEFEKKR